MRIIRQSAFYKCPNLRKAVLNEGLEALGTDEYPEDKSRRWPGVFEESSIEHVELPSTLRRVERCAFGKCRNLKSIGLPKKLEYIGNRCF